MDRFSRQALREKRQEDNVHTISKDQINNKYISSIHVKVQSTRHNCLGSLGKGQEIFSILILLSMS